MSQVQPQHKLVNLRLSWFRHAQQITHNVAKTCRYYGMARRTYYFWWNRYQEFGIEGLKDVKPPKIGPPLKLEICTIVSSNELNEIYFHLPYLFLRKW